MHGQGRQTRGFQGCTCTTTFSAPPRHGSQICSREIVCCPNQPPKVGDFCLPRPGNQVLSFIVELGEKWFSYTPKFSAPLRCAPPLFSPDWRPCLLYIYQRIYGNFPFSSSAICSFTNFLRNLRWYLNMLSYSLKFSNKLSGLYKYLQHSS